MKQLRKKEAIAFYHSGKWETMTDAELVEFQLYQDKLCVPFDRFHKAMESVLGRPVYTHEFAFRKHLREELQGKKPKSTFMDIVSLLPADKTIVIATEL